jgi:hypothetical protein
MRKRIKKHKLGSTKPVTQLFLFSNKLSNRIEIDFSGSVIFEFELNDYDYKYHEEAKQVVDFMKIYCRSLGIRQFKYMTVVLNYKASGLTMNALTGIYDYPIAIHGLEGYKQLAKFHSAYELIERRLSTFKVYKHYSLDYAEFSKKDPINLPERSIVSLKSQLKKTEQSILKSMDKLIPAFHKKFQPSYHK